MSEDKTYVYITTKGRKYHLNIECPYIKGRKTNKVLLEKANIMPSVGACCMCQKSIKKAEGKLKDDDKCQNNSKKTKNTKNNKEGKAKEEEEKNNKNNGNNINNDNNVNNINNIINDNEFEIITNDEQFESKNCKNNLKDNDDSLQSIKRVDKTNKKDNEIPFILPDYSEISSNDNNCISPEKNYKNGEKEYNNKTKNKNSNNMNNFINELNNKEKEDIKDINNCNNKHNNNISINNNKKKSIFDPINKEEDQKVTNEESQNSISNSIDSKEIQNEPLNSINYLKENLSGNHINNINNINNCKKETKDHLNWDKGDYKLLDETNGTAKLLYLKNILEINDQADGNFSILSENKDDSIISNSEQNNIIKGNFKFKFEVIPLNEIDEPFMISVGFEIDYIDETDQNLINKENKKLEDDKNIKMGAVYETLILMRHFYIYKSTNIVHVLLNITKGKFFVVGENELQKRNRKVYLNPDNTEICYVRSFNNIQLCQIKCVRPIFKYNKNSLQIANININGNALKNNKNS